MTAPDATPEDRPRDPAGPAAREDGSPAVADFTGLDSDDGAAASVAMFDDLDEAGSTPYVHPDLLGRETVDGDPDGPAAARTVSLDTLSDGQDIADGDGEDSGSPDVRVASFDGPRPRADRSFRPRTERSRSSTRDRGDGPEKRPGGSSRAGRGGGGLSFSPQDDQARAKEICLRLLTDRARTVQELSQALRRKEIPDEVAQRVLERLDEVGLVDDEAFAGQWVRSRHEQRGLGRRAIAAELHRKGVAKEIADEALTEIDAESEEIRARELVDRKLRTVPIGTKEQRVTAARRLVGMLARKGYGGNIAYRVVKEAIAEHGVDPDELGEGPLD